MLIYRALSERMQTLRKFAKRPWVVALTVAIYLFQWLCVAIFFVGVVWLFGDLGTNGFRSLLLDPTPFMVVLKVVTFGLLLVLPFSIHAALTGTRAKAGSFDLLVDGLNLLLTGTVALFFASEIRIPSDGFEPGLSQAIAISFLCGFALTAMHALVRIFDSKLPRGVSEQGKVPPTTT